MLDLADRRSAPVTTSIGRLFDAVAALLGGRRRVSYEAQAAIELEALARTVDRADAPAYAARSRSRRPAARRARPAPLLARARRRARRAASPAPVIAAGFHEAIGRPRPRWPPRWPRAHGLDTVASPAVCSRTRGSPRSSRAELAAAGLEVLVHEAMPPNDGGISIGQAAIAAARV